MATSGQTSFGYGTTNDDLILEAWERIGRDGSTLSVVQTKSAIRSLNLLFIDWANKGPNLFAVDQLDFSLLPTVPSYSLPQDTVDVLQVVVQQVSGNPVQDLTIARVSRSEYFALPNKAQAGERPTQFYIERTAIPVMYLWEVPQAAGYTLKYYRMRMLQNVGSLTQTPDVANRWLEAICAGLAAKLAVKYAPDRLAMLDPKAAAAYQTAADEDAERVTLRIVPDLTAYYQ